MNKKMQGLTGALLAIPLVLTPVSCGKKGNSASAGVQRNPNEKVDPLNQSEKMPVKIATLTGYTQPNSRTQKWLEERYNLDITIIALPGWADAPTKISLLMADDKERPDLIWWWGMESDFAKWKDAGLLAEVTDYLNKYPNMRNYYNTMNPSTLFFATSEEGKTFRIPGDVSESSCEVLWIRQDWLDNLGLKVPTTLAELEDVIYKFTFNDPDRNGKNDTYGLGGDGYDFRTFWPWIQGSGTGRGWYDGFCILEDGSYAYGLATDDAKIWLERVAKLYKDGVITPNIINDTDRDEEMARGGFGVTYGWISLNNPSYTAMQSFYASNPTAKWIPIEMVKGDNGNPQDNPATAGAWCYFGITKNCKDPERLFAIWDDMAAPDNYIKRRFGIENTDYWKNPDGSYRFITAAENQTGNIGVELFDNFFARKDFCNISNLPETTALFERSSRMSRDVYATKIEKKDPNAYPVNIEDGTEIGDAALSYFWSVIAGTNSIATWDQYIASLKAAGLDQVLAELKTVYDKQKQEQQTYLTNLK
ncbi:MAG: extracellular solute-binding protein [Spirochaetaceae bacterium]|jgi:putative aldouronate transport system substrate-binding protein|nr:extracellular solute-binding protein [Spirochaetaceae bacterium]